MTKKERFASLIYGSKWWGTAEVAAEMGCTLTYAATTIGNIRRCERFIVETRPIDHRRMEYRITTPWDGQTPVSVPGETLATVALNRWLYGRAA